MTVTFTPTGETGILLADDAGGMRVRWAQLPRVRALTDKLTYPEATTVPVVPRGNLEGGFGLAVGRNNFPSGVSTLGAAILFCIQEPYARAGKQGTLAFVETGGGVTLRNVVLEDVAILQQIGIYVVIQYSFTGGNL